MSYLPKVMRPITIIGTIDPKKEYTTTEAVRVVSCGPHALRECAIAGDLPAKQVVDNGRWRFTGADLIDLVARHAKIVEQLAAERKANLRAKQREWKRRNVEKIKKQQQQLPMNDEKTEESKSATWEKLTIYLPVDVATALRHRAVDERCDLSDIIADKLAASFAE